MEKPAAILLNGKFLTGPATGVQRVAAEMIKAIDAIYQKRTPADHWPDVELVTPNCKTSSLDLQAIATHRLGRLTSIPWEQIDLPRLSRGQLIVNLANLGPVASANSITMIHDAQTFSSPASYSRGFRAWYGFVQPLLGRRSRRIITVSEFSKQQLAYYNIAPLDKIDVIHNGVDHVLRIVAEPGAARRLGLQPRQFVLGLANAQPHKNVKILLEAFEDPGLGRLKLVLFGSAKPAALEKLHGRPLPANVMLTGTIADSTLRGLIESALCLAFPSRTEGFGLPPLEAMLLGCPAIVAPCGALPEICGDAALYAGIDDKQQWHEAILTLADSPVFWSDQSIRGSAHAQRFTWRTSAQQLLDIVDQCRSGPAQSAQEGRAR